MYAAAAALLATTQRFAIATAAHKGQQYNRQHLGTAFNYTASEKWHESMGCQSASASIM